MTKQSKHKIGKSETAREKSTAYFEYIWLSKDSQNRNLTTQEVEQLPTNRATQK